MEFTTKASQETKKAGREFATSLVESGKDDLVAGLVGDLGAGKTTFVQGFAEGLGIDQRIVSPTFILMRHYEILPVTIHQSPVTDFYHVDLYRLEDNVEREVVNLGLTDIWESSGNIVMIEWAEKIRDIMPKDAYWLELKVVGEDERKIIVKK